MSNISIEAGAVVINSTPIIGGTTRRLLYDNAGTIGETDITFPSSSTLNYPTTATFTIGGVVKLDFGISFAGSWYFQTSDVVFTNNCWGVVNSATPGLVLNSAGGNFGIIANIDADTWSLGYGASRAVLGTSVISWTDNGPITISPNNSLLEQRNSTNAQTLRIYNTFTDASNYERGIADWNKTANAFTVGTEAAGTGTARPVLLNPANHITAFEGITSSFPALKRSAATLQFRLSDDSAFAFYSWAGELRVSSQFNKAGDTTLATVTGLSVSLAAGRTYAFRVYLDVSPDAVGGHKYAIGTPDTLTASNIIYQVNSVNNTTNANIINSRQTALGGSVGVASGTSDYTEIVGTITVGVAGTLAVQFAQNVASGTSSVLVGSFMIVQDIP